MTDSRDPAAMAAALVDHGAALLGLTIEPAWREGVVRNLGGHLVAARLVMEFPLRDEDEPAPVFEP
jgi:hypothetical protein